MKKRHLVFSFLFFLNYSLFGQTLKYPSIYQCDSFNITRTHYYYSTLGKIQTEELLPYKEVEFIFRFNVLSEDSVVISQMIHKTGNGYEKNVLYEDTSYCGNYSIDSIQSNVVVYPHGRDTGTTTGFKCFEDSITSNYLHFRLYGKNSSVINFHEDNADLNIDSLIDTLTHTLPIGDSLIIDKIKCTYKINAVGILVDLRPSFKPDHFAKCVKMIDIKNNAIRCSPGIDLLGRNLSITSKNQKLSTSLYINRFKNNKR